MLPSSAIASNSNAQNQNNNYKLPSETDKYIEELELHRQLEEDLKDLEDEYDEDEEDEYDGLNDDQRVADEEEKDRNADEEEYDYDEKIGRHEPAMPLR